MNPPKSAKMMKFRLLILAVLFGAFFPNQSQAQEEVDVVNLLADTKTFIFNNNKNTVKGYVYDQLSAQTSCCGQDRIYLEVKIDPSGFVLQVKPLTGKNDCYMQSASDIIKNIRWDATDFKGPKSVYFEIKPNIDCDNRNNNYAQVRIFNNEKVDAQGNRIYPSNPRPSASEVAANPSMQNSDPVAATQPPATQPQPAVTQPPATTQPPVSEPVVRSEPEVPTQPETVKEPEKPAPTIAETTPPPTYPREERPAEETLPMTNTVQPSPVVAADREKQQAQQAANQQSIAQEEELRYLKEQLEGMRQREEELREQRLAEERAAREAARAAEQAFIPEDNTEENPYAYNESEVDYVGKEGEGGLWFTDGSTDSDTESFTEPTDPPKDQSEEGRLQQQMRDVEQKIRDLEQKQLERERIVEQQQLERERDNDEILRLVEQKLMLEEDIAQRQEDKELDQLEKDRVRIEDETARTEDESQRLMDELARLQTELEDKMKAIEDKKLEIQNMAELKMRREQEIQLERALREKERETELLAYRMNLQGATASGVNLQAGTEGTPLTIADLPADFLSGGTPEDSTKLIYLLSVIEQMRGELEFLRNRINELEGGTPSTGITPQTPGRAGSSDGVRQPWDPSQRVKTTAPEGYKSAAEDDSWKTVDNGVDLPVAPVPQTPPSSSGQNQPSGNVSPDASHRDTHANVPGPKFVTRTYAEGEAAVKEKIKSQLRANAVCGLAQAAFSVTVDPAGNVLNYNILASNKATVQTALMGIIPNLKFNRVSYSMNQVVYLDFKADVACDGVDDGTNLKEVESLIKTP
jgi:hypothetical protein